MERRRAVVTGGGTGIGKAIAQRLVDDGLDVVIVGRREEVLRATAQELDAGESGRVSVVTGDLESPEDVRRVAGTLAAGPTIDVLVLNAGGVSLGETDDLESLAAGWRRDFDNNVLTAVLLTEALLDHLTRPGCRVVAMSSVAGFRGAGSYGAAKSALNNWVWTTSARLAADGITVNAVAPGFVPDTEFWDSRRSEELIEQRVAGIPMGRPGSPEHVAEAVAHLAAPHSDWTTGSILHVDGGVTLSR